MTGSGLAWEQGVKKGAAVLREGSWGNVHATRFRARWEAGSQWWCCAQVRLPDGQVRRGGGGSLASNSRRARAVGLVRSYVAHESEPQGRCVAHPCNP